jgi:hypothetical protein
MWANEATSADGPGTLRFAVVAHERASAEFARPAHALWDYLISSNALSVNPQTSGC